MKTITNAIYPAFALFAFACFALSPALQAVDPPPDGGYSGGNTAEGDDALLNLTTGTNNVAVGFEALVNNTSGLNNTACGGGALHENQTGQGNTATGNNALFFSTGFFNTATGTSALQNNGIGSYNTASGFAALFNNANGHRNTANGYEALYQTLTSDNTAIGYNALFNNTGGANNIAIGSHAGENLTTGSNNIDIGTNVLGNAGEANTIRIGKQGTQRSTFIAGIFGTALSGSTVVVNSTGKVGVAASSARFKEQIKPMDKASEAILTLKPVTFHYKKEIDPKGLPQFGLVAEEVQKVNPDLVERDKEGKPFSVRYEAVNAMLLNEFLKEHQTVQELKRQVAELTAGLQKVSVQLELNKPAPQTVLNNR